MFEILKKLFARNKDEKLSEVYDFLLDDVKPNDFKHFTIHYIDKCVQDDEFIGCTKDDFINKVNSIDAVEFKNYILDYLDTCVKDKDIHVTRDNLIYSYDNSLIKGYFVMTDLEIDGLVMKSPFVIA